MFCFCWIIFEKVFVCFHFLNRTLLCRKREKTVPHRTMYVINFILLEHEKYTPVVGFGDESAVVTGLEGAPAPVRLENIRKLSSNLQYSKNTIIFRGRLCFIYRKTSGSGGVRVCSNTTRSPSFLFRYRRVRILLLCSCRCICACC